MKPPTIAPPIPDDEAEDAYDELSIERPARGSTPPPLGKPKRRWLPWPR